MNRLLCWCLVAATCLVAACESDHGHPHEPAAEHDGHAHDAGEEDGHGHGHGGGIVVTHFSDTAELFVEFPPLAVGRESTFAAHFTRLDTFAPVGSGRVSVTLTGGSAGEESFDAEPSPTPGIFLPAVTPRHAGERRLVLELNAGDLTSVHDLGPVTVYETIAAADASLAASEEASGLIPFLKEQQWKLDFATAPVEHRELRRSLPAPATLTVVPARDHPVAAPTDGFVSSTASGPIPEAGSGVSAGDVLFALVPRLGGGEDRAVLDAELAAARVAYDAARTERERIAGLFEAGAVAIKRVQETTAAEHTARARMDAVRARLAAMQGRTTADAGFTVRAPNAGRVTEVNVRAGAFVRTGDALVRIVDDTRLRLTARIADIDVPALGQPVGLWFTVGDGAETYDVRDLDGALVSVGTTIDPVSRTLPVVFEFDNPDRALRPGMSVQAHVATASTFTGAVIPASALIDDAGQDVVFVMADGENWERRIVRVALREGDATGIAAGLDPGERVVSRGAYLVYLAATGPAEAGHGHAH